MTKPLPPWTVLSTTPIFKDRWIDLRAERCRTGAGAVVDPFYVIDRPDWACVLAMDNADRVVVERVWRQGIRSESLELPGGALDPDDASPAVGAERELLEETGYLATSFVPLARLATNPANMTNFAHVFLARDARRVREPALEPGETLETTLMPFDELYRAARDGRMIHAVHVAAVLLARDHLKRR